MTACCITCGRPLDQIDVDGLVLRHGLTPRQSALLRVLSRRPGRLVTHEALVDAVYGDDPGGGPDRARQCIAHFARALKPALAAGGMEVRSVWGQGYVLELRPQKAA